LKIKAHNLGGRTKLSCLSPSQLLLIRDNFVTINLTFVLSWWCPCTRLSSGKVCHRRRQAQRGSDRQRNVLFHRRV